MSSSGMNLYFCDIKNFGDQLNPWLWPKVFDDWVWLQDRLFVGIGTILNTNLPVGVDKVVFGSGAGYKDPPDMSKDRWDILALRGPYTADKLGLPRSLAVTDGAILLSYFTGSVEANKKYKLSVIFHHHSYSYCDWTQYLEERGVHVINPEWSVDEVVSHILMSECVAAEAMHGAILADTLRVPWFSFKMYPHILDFKWLDWSASMDLDYKPIDVRGFFSDDINYPFGFARDVINWLPGRELIRSGLNAASQPLIGKRMLSALRNGQAQLSRDIVFESRRTRMLEIANNLMHDK